jgi:hypothetical protein
MDRRQVKMNRVVKRLGHTLYLSAARSDKQMDIDHMSENSDWNSANRTDATAGLVNRSSKRELAMDVKRYEIQSSGPLHNDTNPMQHSST